MLIRKYEKEDFEDVFWLQRVCYLKPCTREELRDKLAGPAWVGCDTEVMGAVICSEVNNTPWIWSLTVAPPARNQGMGNKLMAAAEEHYSGKEIRLYVDSQNPAEKLYRHRGYATSQVLKDFYGPGYDAIEMFRS